MDIVCNVCRKQVKMPPLEVKKEGMLEIQYITCPSCGQVYVVSVTDPLLKKNVQKYIELRERIRSGSLRISDFKEAETLKKGNVTRSREFIT